MQWSFVLRLIHFRLKTLNKNLFPPFSLWDKRSRKELLVKPDRNFNRTRPYLSTEKDRCTQFPPKTKQKQNKAEQKQSKTKTKRKQIGLFFPPSMCMLQAFPGSRCVLENTFNAIQAERLINNYPIRISTILPFT